MTGVPTMNANSPSTATPLGVPYETALAIGARLKEARETLGRSPATIATRIKIREHYVAAIEQGQWAELPPGLNGRGLIRIYARELGVPVPELEPSKGVSATHPQYEPVGQVSVISRQALMEREISRASQEIARSVPRNNGGTLHGARGAVGSQPASHGAQRYGSRQPLPAPPGSGQGGGGSRGAGAGLDPRAQDIIQRNAGTTRGRLLDTDDEAPLDVVTPDVASILGLSEHDVPRAARPPKAPWSGRSAEIPMVSAEIMAEEMFGGARLGGSGTTADDFGDAPETQPLSRIFGDAPETRPMAPASRVAATPPPALDDDEEALPRPLDEAPATIPMNTIPVAPDLPDPGAAAQGRRGKNDKVRGRDEEHAAREAVAREAALREQAGREAAAREQAIREAATGEQAAREAAAREQAARESAAREAVAREAVAREVAIREQAARETEARDAAAREQAAREAAAREVSAWNAAAREQAARNAAAEEQATREAAAREQATREAAAREQAAREAAAIETPAVQATSTLAAMAATLHSTPAAAGSSAVAPASEAWAGASSMAHEAPETRGNEWPVSGVTSDSVKPVMPPGRTTARGLSGKALAGYTVAALALVGLGAFFFGPRTDDSEVTNGQVIAAGGAGESASNGEGATAPSGATFDASGAVAGSNPAPVAASAPDAAAAVAGSSPTDAAATAGSTTDVATAGAAAVVAGTIASPAPGVADAATSEATAASPVASPAPTEQNVESTRIGTGAVTQARLTLLEGVEVQVTVDGKRIHSGVQPAGELVVDFKKSAEIFVGDGSKVRLTYGTWEHGLLGHEGRKRRIFLNAESYTPPAQ